MMAAIGVGILISSYWITDNDMKNIGVGLGAGVVTSALISLYIDAINKKIEKSKLKKYKIMLLNPLYKAVYSLYVLIAIYINEYRVEEGISGYLFLPTKKMKDWADFFNELRKYDWNSKRGEKKKKFDNMLYIREGLYIEVISQFRGLPVDSLLYENIISYEEFETLKQFDLVNICIKILTRISENDVSEKEEYALRIQLLQSMMLLINRILNAFPDMQEAIMFENTFIKLSLDHKAEDYAGHPEESKSIEESEEDILHRKIKEAIRKRDVEAIKQLFPEIDKNNKRIKLEFEWITAEAVMKDKDLRKMYYEKYGIKYKMWREKRLFKRKR